jgi:cytochrome c
VKELKKVGGSVFRHEAQAAPKPASGAALRLVAAGVISAALALALSACASEERRAAAEMTGGDPARGVAAIRHYGCGSCHSIPGVDGANSLVGPPLGRMAQRTYIAGVLTNSPENMIRWLRDPPAVDHLTAMPKLGLTEQEARDVASYLYTLR